MSERDPLFVENEALRAQAERVKAIAELGVREQWPPDEWRAALLSSSEPVTAGPERHRCIACPEDVRNLYAVANNACGSYERQEGPRTKRKMHELRSTLNGFSLVVDGHFSAPITDVGSTGRTHINSGALDVIAANYPAPLVSPPTEQRADRMPPGSVCGFCAINRHTFTHPRDVPGSLWRLEDGCPCCEMRHAVEPAGEVTPPAEQRDDGAHDAEECDAWCCPDHGAANRDAVARSRAPRRRRGWQAGDPCASCGSVATTFEPDSGATCAGCGRTDADDPARPTTEGGQS